MKTLDEVIELNEKILRFASLPINDTTTTAGLALHYLREYREMKEHLACLDDAEIRGDDTQIVNNPALSWDELKAMEGKPVWVEDNTGYKHYQGWAIILKFLYSDTFMLYVCNDYSETCVDVHDIGKTWNAYRRERE